jgi:hypothetical protein
MPSHFSTIGFSLDSQEDLVDLAQQISGQAQALPVKRGQYLRWTGAGGEELWLQIDESGDLIGMNPHFNGKASMQVRLDARVHRDSDTALDGAFEGWAMPDADPAGQGAYPFVFDSPDSATYGDLSLPGMAEVQVAAFAHEAWFHESPAAYAESQAAEKFKFASQSFIPSGSFAPDGTKTDPPEAMAIFAGHVKEASTRKNSITGASFYWALVDSLGGLHDVVIDRSLLSAEPTPGGVLFGQFWLSGRIISAPRATKNRA